MSQDLPKEPIEKEAKQEVVEPESLRAPEAAETKEVPKKEEVASEAIADLKNTIEAADLADDLRSHVQVSSQSLQSMSDDDKVASLLKQAREKGVVFAVTVAKSLNNPYVLDKLHDALIANGSYGELLK